MVEPRFTFSLISYDNLSPASRKVHRALEKKDMVIRWQTYRCSECGFDGEYWAETKHVTQVMQSVHTKCPKHNMQAVKKFELALMPTPEFAVYVDLESDDEI